MKVDKYGAVIINSDELFNAIYSGKIKSFENVFLDDITEITKFNTSVKSNFDEFDSLKEYIPSIQSLQEFDISNQINWFMPDEYKNIDIEQYLVSICPEQNYQRLVDELQLFNQHNMMDLLRYIKYLVDVMRKHKIVWGVGRGSSVASYVLFLLGIHKIDSIKYELDINEFLK